LRWFERFERFEKFERFERFNNYQLPTINYQLIGGNP